jgi:hypothetical protein
MDCGDASDEQISGRQQVRESYFSRCRVGLERRKEDGELGKHRAVGQNEEGVSRRPATRRMSGAVRVAPLLAILASLAAPVVSQAACPNETLRLELRSGQLPDCRAYELVSPPYTEGVILTSVYGVSPEGERLIVGSLGTFAGSEQISLNTTNVIGGAYLLSRVSGGWMASSLDPSSREFHGGGGMLDASTDLDASLWELGTRAQSEVRDLYIEQPLGHFSKIGPATSSSTPNTGKIKWRGASEDLSRVLFSVKPPDLRWPFDQTVESGGTLYEYQYAGLEQQDPSLVGVEGGRGSEALISRCGTQLGSSSTEETERAVGPGSTYNAISASGNRVFFTAVGTDQAGGCEGPPVDELFAREELSPTEFRTVAISEPSQSYCVPPPPTPSPPCADAHFEGASRDGSRVFFTSTQKLLEGATEGSSNLYEYEFEPGGTHRLGVISAGSSAPQVQGVARISEDGSHVYFVANGVLTDSPNSRLETATEGTDNLYLFERDEQYPEGHISFIVTLASTDSRDWAHEDDRPVQVSGEGRYLVFISTADLTGEGISTGVSQVFQYDASTGSLVRASIGQDGYGDNDRDPVAGATIVNFPSSRNYANSDSPVSVSDTQAPADGAVFFESPDALTPTALADKQDFIGQLVPNIYEYRSGNVYLLSDGHDVSTVNDNPGSSMVGWDPSGDDVFFFTADSLIPADGNTRQDLYDARVEGGFPAPASPSINCVESCQGSLSSTPALTPPGGSATQTPAESLLAPPAAPNKMIVRPLTRAQKLAKALKACRQKRNKHARASCEKQASHAYGKAKK